jgi:CRISPR-associated protein Csb1
MEDEMTSTLALAELQRAISGEGVAIRSVRRLMPVGGPADKVFPASYGVDDRAPHKYCTEKRRINGADVETVLLDSVQSQANRMEQALLEAWRRRELNFPVVAVDFAGEGELEDLGQITSLDAPHRLADALLRDSTADGKPFRLTTQGAAFTEARLANATAMYQLCPTALVFGIWDSTGPKGGLGAKFARALVSEIVGIGAVVGRKTSSRIDPVQIQKLSKDSPVYQGKDGTWTLDEKQALTEKGKPVPLGTGRPSEINHGNIAPSIDERTGGVTIDYAQQTIVLSLSALRRIRFPKDAAGERISTDRLDATETAARNVLAALALAGIVYQAEDGYDLRSRCSLMPESPLALEIVGSSGEAPRSFALGCKGARALLEDAHKEAATRGLGWSSRAGEPILTLKPAPKLADLIRRSRAHAATTLAGE